ncbi:MAG: hypothetical protein ABH952_07170 [Candidatus Omnitrophota bacterium]
MKQYGWTAAIIVFFLLGAGICPANEGLFYKEVTRPQNIENEAGAVTFDSDMYRNTDNSFANLRIYDKNNNEVPFVVRKLRGYEKTTKDYPVKEEKLVYGERKTVPYALNIRDVKLNKEEKTSEVYLDSKREPLMRILIDVKSENFKRKVEVEGTNDLGADAKWIKIVSAEILNINTGQFRKEKLKIDLPANENRYLRYCLRIFNNDNAPVKVGAISAEGFIHEILFFHNNNKSLRLYYGGEGFKFPNYDLSSVLAEIPPVTGERWKIGLERKNEAAGVKKKPIILPKRLFVIVLTIMVIVLGWLVVVSVRKVDEETGGSVKNKMK